VLTDTTSPIIEDPPSDAPSSASCGARPGSDPHERSGPSTGASVLVDIGEGAGALVVYTSETLLGREIEIRPHGGSWAGVHTAVRARHMGERVLHAGVFGTLPVGHYDLRVRSTSPGHGPGAHHHGSGPGAETAEAVLSVRVHAGTVVETTLLPSG
jgi:hypothetical protein